jgi:hypothetical protein
LLKSPSDAENWFGLERATPPISEPLLSSVRKFLALQFSGAGLPIDAGHRCLIDHHEGGQARTCGNRKVRRGDLLQVEVDDYILGNPPPFGSSILQAVKPFLHLRDATLEAGGWGLIGMGGADYGRDNLV